MQDLESEGQAPASIEVNEPAQPAPQIDPAPDVAAERIAALEAQLGGLRSEAAKHRIAKNEERAAKTAALEANQEYKALADERKTEIEAMGQRVSELQGDSVKAKAYDEYVAAKTEDVGKSIDALPDWFRATVEALPDVFAQAKAIESFSAQQTDKPKPPPSVTAAPALDSEDIRGMSERDPAKWEAFKKAHGMKTKTGGPIGF